MPVLKHGPRKTVQRFCDHDMRQNMDLGVGSESERSRHASSQSRVAFRRKRDQSRRGDAAVKARRAVSDNASLPYFRTVNPWASKKGAALADFRNAR
jgi:hypothetical protein